MNENDTPASPSNMLVFSDMAELLSASTQVSKMSDAEFDAYETLNGYKSFGRMAEEVFFSVDPEDFTSEQEMLDYLDANKDYITLTTDENGELTAEPAFDRSEYQYLMNEDQMFEINGTVYKVFEKGMVSVLKTQVSELMTLDSENLQTISGNAKFAYTPFQSELLTKGIGAGYGEMVTPNEKYRACVRLETYTKSEPGFNPDPRYVKLSAWANKKTMGVWWAYERIIHYNIDVDITFTTNTNTIGTSSYFENKKIEERNVVRYICENEPVNGLTITRVNLWSTFFQMDGLKATFTYN